MDPHTAKIGGVAPKTLLTLGQVLEVQGSGKKPWVIKRKPEGLYTCSCGAFQCASNAPARTRSCAHLRSVLGEEYERARLEHEDERSSGSPSSSRPAGMAKRASSSSLKRGRGSESSSQVSLSNDQADYTELVDEHPHVLASTSKPQPLTEYDPWTGNSTFNGRALPKDFDPHRAVSIMLSETWDLDKMNPKGWWMSEKLDGCRAYWTGQRLISRTGKDWKAPAWFLEKLPKDFALDGELWRERDGFEELSGMCQRSDSSAWRTINYFVFDAPDLKLPFEERLEAARRKVPDGEMSPDQALRGKFGGRIATLPQVACNGKKHLLSHFKEILDAGGEGLVLRRRNSPYERKRSTHSRKLKHWYDGEGIVVGYAAGQGRYKGQMGSLGLLMECGTIFTCGSGLTDEMRRDWSPPVGTVVRYRFNELTQDGVPRFPIFVGCTYDRHVPKDAVVKSSSLRAAKRMRLEEEAASEDARRVQMADLVKGKSGGRAA